MDNLTIILPLKGRPDYTQRFLRHVCKWNCPVIVADGSLSPQRHLVEGWGAEYHYHEPDHTLGDYWAKMVWALDLVQTPYAMICDNDDFPLYKGQTRCIEFLEAHPDFVCASGRIQGFWLFPDKLLGPLSYITKQYAPYDTPATFDQDGISDRVLAGFTNSWSYYAIYRTKALRQIWRGVQALGLRDLQVHEKYCAMETLLQGKAICFPDVTSYLRQYETSTRDTSIVKDWALRFARGEWTNDVVKVLTIMGAQGVDRSALHNAWGNWYANHLNRHFGLYGKLRHKAKELLPNLAYAFQHRHQLYPQKRTVWDVLYDQT